MHGLHSGVSELSVAMLRRSVYLLLQETYTNQG